MKMYIKILSTTKEYYAHDLIKDVLDADNKMVVYVGEREYGKYDPICITGYVSYDVGTKTFKFTKADTEMARTIDIVLDERVTSRVLRLFPIVNEVDGRKKCELLVLEDTRDTFQCIIE